MHFFTGSQEVIHPSIFYTRLIKFRLESIPTVIGREAGYTLDRLTVLHRTMISNDGLCNNWGSRKNGTHNELPSGQPLIIYDWYTVPLTDLDNLLSYRFSGCLVDTMLKRICSNGQRNTKWKPTVSFCFVLFFYYCCYNHQYFDPNSLIFLNSYIQWRVPSFFIHLCFLYKACSNDCGLGNHFATSC